MSLNDYQQSKQLYEDLLGKTVGLSKRIEIHIQILLILYKEHDFKQFLAKLEDLKNMVDSETEWEKKTKVIIFESIAYLIKRDLDKAFEKMQLVISTYNFPDLMPYE